MILESGQGSAVVQCRACGLVYVNPQPDAAGLAQHYNEEYYRPWLTQQKGVRAKMWQRRLADIEKFRGRGRILDVGCGPGIFLQHAQAAGWQAWGTDISVYAAQYAKEHFNSNVVRGGIEQAGFDENFFDVITFWHSLEHYADPLGELVQAHRVLAPSGKLILAVPNVENYLYTLCYMLCRGKKPRLFSVDIREAHLYHFSNQTLEKLLVKAGFATEAYGLDMGKTRWQERFLEAAALGWYTITGKNIGTTIKVLAHKKCNE